MFELTIASLVALSITTAYFTNPFVHFSLIRLPFRARIHHELLETINNNKKIVVHNSWYWRLNAVLQSGLYILNTRYIHSPATKSTTVDGIIREIHNRRYDPTKLLLISGDHFNSLFVRNLGVFYYPLLDAAIPSDRKDWQNRQIVYLQTVAYALGVYTKSPVPTTTIVPSGRYAAVNINFYAYPSDTVFGILYALVVLAGKESARPFNYAPGRHHLDTTETATLLINTYRPTLQRLYTHYRTHAFDEQTGLIRRDFHMSGAKDITRRYSAFYDNVIFWKTTKLAMKLGIIVSDISFLNILKKNILKTFWLEKEGYFLEDLSREGLAKKYYSSDWLIVLSTGFLNPANPKERPYFERSVAYIRRQKIDQPFAIKYQLDRRAHRQFLAVRLAVASYGGDSIWSFWGMEYIKTLIALYNQTGTKSYLHVAKYHLDTYKALMKKNNGFPEVYDAKGNLLQTLFYRSIRQTGWVIGFEQTLEMYTAATSIKNNRLN